ncbi:MAG: glycogen/starch/alpha-glucan phosphorylase [Anaerolineae bacterium]|nr:glycogen/starch/alpha-glucan phosphorylase [Anaerolineae bacterium]
MNNSESITYRPIRTVDGFRQKMLANLHRRRGTTIHSASQRDIYFMVAHTVRDYLIDRWTETVEAQFRDNPKFVYYLSAEYLPGRQLEQNMLYADVEHIAREACAELGIDLDQIMPYDPEPGLGNGGLGRLAACFLDSLATLDIPAVGYGIRYEFGIFRQTFRDGWQVELPDDWLTYHNPWEFPQPDDMVEIGMYGYTEQYNDAGGNFRVRWIPGETVRGEPYHTLVPGYKTGTVNILRLWRARASHAFNFQVFDTGDYTRAVAEKVSTENISKVLYPNDNAPQGRELRLKQQYFFVACSLHDIIRRFHIRNDNWDDFPEKVVIQLNDTHPVIAIPELMRILMDVNDLGWDQAWDITRRTFAYTCHTLLPEALEKWPVDLIGRILPRHLEIIYELNQRFLDDVRERFPHDPSRLVRMSLIEEGPQRRVRMANLATLGSFSVNGVAELHTHLLRERTLRDFAEMWPERFNNKTNGVTPRRFIRIANPRLFDLITEKIGTGWLRDLERLRELEPFVDDPDFRTEWRAVKRRNKRDLAGFIAETVGVAVDHQSLYDVMVKRLHEYKRQLLKALHIITLYHRVKDDPQIDIVPRTFIFGAKAAPGYQMAKLIIKLINSLAYVVNTDPDVHGRLRVVFIPNFNVSAAQKIYPAADISEQISLAGKEASGTGNMKFALNGALTTGTLDGANIEIRERVGAENFFLFGMSTEEVFALKASGYNPMDYYRSNPVLKRAIDAIARGDFSFGQTELFQPIVDSLLYKDEYLLLADYQAYIDCQDRAAAMYRNQEQWTRMSILNTARCGFFSSDRSMRQYSADIWHVKPIPVDEV